MTGRSGLVARAVRIGAALVLAASLAGCAAPAPDPTPAASAVTTEQSQLLAAMRFTNFDAGTRPFTTTVGEGGTTLALHGWVDYATHTGYAAVTGEGFAPQALLWTDTTVALIPAEPDADGMPPLPIPGADDPTWLSRAIDASASALDRRLVLIGSLGSDRPENPLLLQQTGALWLGEDEVDGTAVTVFAAPPSDEVAEPGSVDADTSPLRLWVTADALLLRAQTRVDGAWQDVDFGTAAGPDLEAPADE
ncbi:MAG: hypothetical protein DI566_01785 [Microbacterium sp.]|nr:MAG: hypothetical protein DI566_01785 [Microbacterium sp.]